MEQPTHNSTFWQRGTLLASSSDYTQRVHPRPIAEPLTLCRHLDLKNAEILVTDPGGFITRSETNPPSRWSFMKRLILLTSLFLTVSCASQQYQIRPDMDLNVYRYVLLQESSPELHSELTPILGGLGFKVLDRAGVQRLGEKERQKVLVYHMQSLGTEKEATVRVQLFDLVGGHRVYASEATSKGREPQANVVLAARKSLEGIFANYKAIATAPALDKAAVRTAAEPLPAKGKPQSNEKSVNDDSAKSVWENIPKSREELIKYFDSKALDLDPIEGIWTDTNNEYTVAVFRNTIAPRRDFVGIALAVKQSGWNVCDVQMEIRQTANARAYTASFFLPDKSKVGGTMEIDQEDRLRGTFEEKGRKHKVSFLRNYPENFAQSGSKKRSGPVSFGSGFFIDTKGLVVTNYHVVDKPGDLKVVFPGLDEELDAELVMTDKRNDLAVLRFRPTKELSKRLGPLPYRVAAPKNVKVGQETVVIGFPLGSDLGRNHKVGTGIISSLSGVNDDPGRMQISNPIQPGNSGGPVFNRKGEVVGVVVAGLDDKFYYEKKGFVPQNVNFAIKLHYLQGVLDLFPAATITSPMPDAQAPELTLENIVERNAPFVVQVKNYVNKRKEPSAVLQDPKPEKKGPTKTTAAPMVR
jgi:S1-C subfamily serine protease